MPKGTQNVYIGGFTMKNNEKKVTGSTQQGCYFDSWDRNGNPIKMYVPSKEEDEED